MIPTITLYSLLIQVDHLGKNWDKISELFLEHILITEQNIQILLDYQIRLTYLVQTFPEQLRIEYQHNLDLLWFECKPKLDILRAEYLVKREDLYHNYFRELIKIQTEYQTKTSLVWKYYDLNRARLILETIENIVINY